MKHFIYIFSLLLLSCSLSDSPSDVAIKFTKLMDAGEFSKASEYLTPQSLSMMETIKRYSKINENPDGRKIEAVSEKISGEIAEVVLKINDVDRPMKLFKIDGKWKIQLEMGK